jgi:Uma2 family endonuclease
MAEQEAMMAVAPQLYTIQDVIALPDDAHRYELVRGELRRMSPAGRKHGRLIMNLSTPLDQFVRDHRLGVVYAAETGFIIETNPDTLRAPDLAFVRQERVAAAPDDEGYFPGPPDLAVEFISPHDLYTEVDEKVLDYLDAGTRMVMIVNPRKRTVTVYRSRSDISLLTAEDVVQGGDVLPGWSLPVSAIFSD